MIFQDQFTTSLAKDKEVIIMGDLNCNYSTTSNHTEEKEPKSTFKLNGFEQLIKKPTRSNQTSEFLIEVIFINP